MVPEVALEWIDTSHGVLKHMGCHRSSGGILPTLRTWGLDQISWDEFRGMFYIQYFSATVGSQKKFISLEQKEGMSVAKY